MSENLRPQSTRPARAIWESREPQRLPWWLSTIVILGALLMATGGVIALVHPGMLASPKDQITGTVQVYAGYLVSRNLALAFLLVVMLGIRASQPVCVLVLLTALIQLLDAGMDCLEGRWTLVPGVLVFAVAYFFCASWLSGHALWKIDTWRNGS